MSALPPQSLAAAPQRPPESAAAKIASARARAAMRPTPATPTPAPAAPRAAERRPLPGTGPGAGREEVRGRILRVLFSSAETGKVMLLLQRAEGGTVKLQGVPAMVVEVGRQVVAWASVETHPRYGEQFSAEIIDDEIPLDRRGAIAYMSRTLEGVGEALAGRIYDAFGQSTYEVISHQPNRLREVSGIGEAKLQAIVDSWTERSVIRTLWSHLAKHEGIGGSVPAKIYARFGDRAMEVVRTRPYEIARIDGIGFKTADTIALDSGMPRDSVARIAGAISHILEHDSQQGHTSKPVAAMVTEVGRITELTQPHDAERIGEVVESLVSRGELELRELGGHPCLTPKVAAHQERAIARRLRELADAGGADKALAELARERAQSLGDAEQVQAVANAFMSPVSVITGRPGCGKTTVTKVLAGVAADAGMRIVMCAPTGKAARRTTEATGFKSGTVHSLIGFRPGESGGMELEHHRNNPLDGDLFVVDESSMLDTFIANAFFEAVPDGARVVLVGDADQLPSVGPGNVLHDIIASGAVAVSQLKTIHRTAMDSDIIVNAHHIIAGKASSVNLRGAKDFQFRAATEDADIVACAVSQYVELVQKHGVENVQVLAARRGTATGVHALNEALRAVVNPPSPDRPFIERGAQVLRLGDRVIRTSNNRRLGVSNGEVGIIRRLDSESKTVVVNFGDRDVVHDRKELGALELAYAITAHKSQGSEYAGLVLVVPRSHKFMLTRNLLYTAVTRGKKDVRLVGAADAVTSAALKPGARRCTGLASEIRAALAPLAATSTPAPDSDSDSGAEADATAKQADAAPASAPAAVEAARKSLFRRRP